VGVIQRVLCAVWFTWLIVLALRLRTVASRVAVPAPARPAHAS
jgi:hypothetical protein